MEEDADTEFVRVSFQVLSNDALTAIFSHMTPADIVRLCPMLGDRCKNIKWVYVLRKITKMDLLEANFNSVVSIADQTCKHWYNLNWPLNVDFNNDEYLDPRGFIFHPIRYDGRPGSISNLLSRSGPGVPKVCVPADSVVNYWVLISWSIENGRGTVHNTYDKLITQLEDDLYHQAFNETKIDTYFTADEVYDALEELERQKAYFIPTREDFTESYPENLEEGQFYNYDLSRLYAQLYKIPTIYQLKKIFNYGQGYYKNEILGSFSISHTTFSD